MLSHKNYCSFLGACHANKDVTVSENDVALSCLPLPHVLERELVYAILNWGGTIVYFCGDIQKIREDLALVRPTIFVSVPRILSRFYEGIKKEVGKVTGWQKTAFDYALSVKLQNVAHSGSYTHRTYDKLVFRKTRALLGGRTRVIISGSAPLLPEVHKFLKVTMCAPLL
jgi:long-chain acyl-CoA synthetase